MINELQELAKDMESSLDKWKECISIARKDYYELNYYTTVQLLTLRQILGKFKNSSTNAVVTPDILALLQCIHPDVDHGTVKKAVMLALCESVDLQQQEDSNTLDETCYKSESSVPSHGYISELSTINTSHSIRPAVLHLTETQKAIVAHVTSRVGCSQKLVVKAFEHLDLVRHQHHDFVEWCANNMDLASISDGSEHSVTGSDKIFQYTESDDDDDDIDYNDEFGSSSGIYVYLWHYCG